MVAKRLKSGRIGYYWDPPSWAKKASCPVQGEALGTGYATAKNRCDRTLNPQYDTWRTRAEVFDVSERAAVGTFDWMLGAYKSNPRYSERPAKTRKSYDAAARIVSQHQLKDGRRFGELHLKSIVPGVADRLFAKLKMKADGGERLRTAVLAAAVCKVAWITAHREHPTIVPLENPLAGVRLNYRAKPTRPVRPRRQRTNWVAPCNSIKKTWASPKRNRRAGKSLPAGRT